MHKNFEKLETMFSFRLFYAQLLNIHTTISMISEKTSYENFEELRILLYTELIPTKMFLMIFLHGVEKK